MPRIALLALMGILLATAGPAAGQGPCVDYGTTGWWPAALMDLPSDVTELATTEDGRLLAASDAGVLVYDLADPLAPVLESFIPADVPLREIAVDGTTVAALTMDNRLLLGVLTSPSQSRWVGELPLSGASLLEMDDGLVVVRQLFDQMATVDVTDPKVPHYLGFLQFPEPIHDLRVAHGLAFAATQYSLLSVCSLADPARPEIISTAASFATGFAVELDFPRVRVANITQVMTFDLSDPTDPVRLHISPRMLGEIEYLAADRDRTFALTAQGHIHNLATVGPDSLYLVGHNYEPEPARHGITAGGLLYVVREPRILAILDPASGNHPPHVFEKLDRATAIMSARGEHVYAMDDDHPEGSRLVISEIDPGQGLVERGFLPIFGDAVAMDLEGERLVFSSELTTLGIVDIADPAAPTYVSLRNDDFFVRDVALLDDLVAFIGRDDLGGDLLVFYDRSQEPELILGGAVRVPFGASQVVRSRNHALVQTEFEMNGIMLVDAAEAYDPIITDWLAIPAPCMDVLAAGEYAYVLTTAGTVEIVDLSDPSRMTIVRSLELDAGEEGSLALVASTLLVQDANKGITFVDVTDPAAAVVIGASWLPTRGRILAGTYGLLTDDPFNRQRFHLPALCGAVSAVEAPPSLFLPTLAAHPNPFNPHTELVFDLSGPATFDLVVYDLAGRRVRTLAQGRPAPGGPIALSWDGRDDAGRGLAAGIYLARLGVDGRDSVAKLVLVR
ncbi:MAG: hypothetical protein GY838_07245 [bacterium]|nr:hypothetical protein [bacterium]